MPINILTFLTNMVKLLYWPRFIGPLTTVILIAVNQVLIAYGIFPTQVAWLYLPVALSALTGLRAGLVSAMTVAAYSIWLNPADPQRTVIIPLSVLVLAVGIGLQSRSLRRALISERAAWHKAAENEVAAAALGDINGNILRIRHARNIMLKTLENHPLDELTRAELHQALHTLNNLELATAGWQALEKLKAEIERDRKTAEAKGMQAMSDLKVEITERRRRDDGQGPQEQIAAAVDASIQAAAADDQPTIQEAPKQ